MCFLLRKKRARRKKKKSMEGAADGVWDGFVPWAVEALEVPAGGDVLEVECGDGLNIGAILDSTDGLVWGIDLSESHAEAFEENNKEAMDAGRTAYFVSDGGKFPFPDARFRGAITLNTACHWGDMVEKFTEISRVLDSGSLFVVACSSPKDCATQAHDDIVEALGSSGFVDVLDKNDGRGNMLVVGKKA